MTRLILAAAVLCAPLLSLPALAQTTGQPGFEHITGHEKKPHKDTVLTTKALPPADSKRLVDKLHQIRDLILATPALKSLHGHDWETFTTVKNHSDGSRPVLASVSYIAFPYLKDPRSGKPISSEEGPRFSIHINDPEVILGQEPYTVDPEARFTQEPLSAGELNGMPVYAGKFAVLSKSGQPVFIPVSQERYLQRLLEKSRQELKEVQTSFSDVPEDPAAKKRDITSRQEALKTARAEQEQRWSAMNAKWPDRVAAERSKFDAKEKKLLQEIDELKTSSPRQRFMAPFETRIKALEAELAALPPAQRSAPAYLPRLPNPDRACGLAAPGSTDGTRIVTINPALFDPKKPKGSVQLIVLGTTQYFPQIYDQVQQQLDLGALKALLD